ncbi:NACHT domain protein [Talaromyces proteolyticus]|uniref:NACHT domain protein n=1 Tax=Talaromyces proteolyticus TaxID=1131652 RepID=A0AAD4PUW5_9EURO|nr:NACHT domain protein [Talaromyces proteolyticus]KAH8690624.1 NACHT domain protein [Talaromyces proteolyticus]
MPLRRDPALAAAQRMVREAFEDLNKAVSPADSGDFETTTLQSVQNAALEIENQLAARQSLRNMRRLMPLFSGLGHYAKTIEVLCNGTPYLPWIWAPIKLILKISSDYVEAFEQIVKAYSRIGESLTRFKVLSETFSQNTEFQQTFAVFYVDILQFHKEAYKFVRRSGWRIFFLTSWGRFQRRFDSILEDLARHEQQIDKEANAYNIFEARNMRKALEEWRQENLAKVKHEEEEQTARQLEAICRWLKKNETDQSLIFDRASTEGSKHPGTCSWVTKNSKISTWLRNDQSDVPFIWLQGNPGTGKTVIVGQLIKFLNSSPTSFVVSHFCTYSYASSIQYDEILKSLLFQMLLANSDAVAHIYGVYVVERKQTSILLLEQLLQTAITAWLEDRGHQHTLHMLVDGLDEVDSEKQNRIINVMNRILKASPLRSGTLKVLFSSRSSQLLNRALRKKPTISLSDEKDSLELGICAYAEQRLKAQTHRLSQLGLQDADFADIGQSIARRADGMFLWARLVLDYLTHNMFYNNREIWDAIETLPRKLAEFYERVLVQMMTNFDSRSVDRMRSIFGWIAFAKRPLRKFELRSALSFDARDPMANDPVPHYIFDMAVPLIEERLDSTLAFIHVSVKDYLEMSDSKLPIVRDKAIYKHGLASATCLESGLNVFNPGFSDYDRNTRVLKGLHGFHVYANEYWIDYVLEALSSTDPQIRHSDLLATLERLSNKLASLDISSYATSKESQFTSSGELLDLIKEYPALYKNAKITLQARARKTLGSMTDQEEYLSAELQPIQELGDALKNYQATIRALLVLRNFPAITTEELEHFQQEHSISAFTCRLPSCPRATVGFENKESQLKHEATHAPCIKCSFPGCQYPSFRSARALKNHEVNCHNSASGRQRIRKADTLASQQTTSDHGEVSRKYGQDAPPNEKDASMVEREKKSDLHNDLYDDRGSYLGTTSVRPSISNIWDLINIPNIESSLPADQHISIDKSTIPKVFPHPPYTTQDKNYVTQGGSFHNEMEHTVTRRPGMSTPPSPHNGGLLKPPNPASLSSYIEANSLDMITRDWLSSPLNTSLFP